MVSWVEYVLRTGESSVLTIITAPGVPSPSAVEARGGSFGKSSRTPLLQTTPLLYEIFTESEEDAIFNFRRGVSPATTPVKILISEDWRMGVAMFQPSHVWSVSLHLNFSK
jgi:hypothetical protein